MLIIQNIDLDVFYVIELGIDLTLQVLYFHKWKVFYL